MFSVVRVARLSGASYFRFQTCFQILRLNLKSLVYGLLQEDEEIGGWLVIKLQDTRWIRY